MNEAAPPGPAASSLLSLRTIGKRFGAVRALDGVDLDVAPGSFTCLIGPSGCGKTTLLRVICGLEMPDEGRILSRGRDIARLPPAARQMGLVFQSYALFPNLRVDQNIAYGLPRAMPRGDKAARVDALLETVGLAGFAARRPDQLSGGQQQRVAIARALAPEPSILLLDEPLSALDAQVRAQVRAELKALQRRVGVTTIMVTHDQGEALAIADSVAVMQAGKVVQAGAPQEVCRAPANRFVADFLGAMDLLPATVAAPDAVRLAGGERLAAPVSDYAIGTPVELGIRPEHLRVFPRKA